MHCTWPESIALIRYDVPNSRYFRKPSPDFLGLKTIKNCNSFQELFQPYKGQKRYSNGLKLIVMRTVIHSTSKGHAYDYQDFRGFFKQATEVEKLMFPSPNCRSRGFRQPWLLYWNQINLLFHLPKSFLSINTSTGTSVAKTHLHYDPNYYHTAPYPRSTWLSRTMGTTLSNTKGNLNNWSWCCCRLISKLKSGSSRTIKPRLNTRQSTTYRTNQPLFPPKKSKKTCSTVGTFFLSTPSPLSHQKNKTSWHASTLPP